VRRRLPSLRTRRSRPTGKPRVIDPDRGRSRCRGLVLLDVRAAGRLNLSKFCCEWVFADGRTTVLSLWHDALSVEAERFVHRANFGDDAAVQVCMGRAAL